MLQVSTEIYGGAKVTDLAFWLTLRRHVVAIAKAIAKRYGWGGLVVLLTGKPDKEK